MGIYEIVNLWIAARQKETELARKHSGEYDMQAHYRACDETSRLAVLMINHPDWSAELADQWYPSAIGDIAYPVSC